MNEESLFAAALSKATGAERQAFLDAACGSDHLLRKRVEELLAADQHPAGILERGLDATGMRPTQPEPPLVADRIFAGRFKLR